MKALEQWIKDRDLTQKAFGKLIGVSQATVSDYLRGKIEPDFDKLHEIRKLTGISFDQLIGKTKQVNGGGPERGIESG